MSLDEWLTISSKEQLDARLNQSNMQTHFAQLHLLRSKIEILAETLDAQELSLLSQQSDLAELRLECRRSLELFESLDKRLLEQSRQLLLQREKQKNLIRLILLSFVFAALFLSFGFSAGEFFLGFVWS